MLSSLSNKLKTLLDRQKPASLLLRICGVFGGAIAGVIVTAFLYVVLALVFHIIGSGTSMLCMFVGAGGTLGSTAGFIYPRQMLKLAWNAMCGCIPGY